MPKLHKLGSGFVQLLGMDDLENWFFRRMRNHKVYNILKSSKTMVLWSKKPLIFLIIRLFQSTALPF